MITNLVRCGLQALPDNIEVLPRLNQPMGFHRLRKWLSHKRVAWQEIISHDYQNLFGRDRLYCKPLDIAMKGLKRQGMHRWCRTFPKMQANSSRQEGGLNNTALYAPLPLRTTKIVFRKI